MINLISNNKTEMKQKENLSGVYKINREKCDKTYIGETGRKFTKRVDEHEVSLKKKDEKSLFGKHANEENHENVDLKQKFEILRIENDTQKRKLFEQLEIIKLIGQNNLLNSVTKFESEKLLKLTI